ncbi:hypothetical protein F66182_4814 [Fusarium sp. NRRL 66182]|nr:hypothetical protein F66182_4814 [Fusarium sp. NRRL 66182]
MLFILSVLISLSTLVAAQKYPVLHNSSCVSGAHIIVARGSLEPPGPGILGAVAQQIMDSISNSETVSLGYPAMYDPYKPSQTQGVRTLTRVIEQYADVCPRTKMILLGFSQVSYAEQDWMKTIFNSILNTHANGTIIQGAHIIADVMCGASSAGFPATEPQSPEISNNIAAIVLLGDPSTTVGQPFHAGSSQGDGIFPRQRPNGCERVSTKIISFCDAGDPFCEAGGHDLSVHMNYVTTYGSIAAGFSAAMFHRVG